jgi:NADH-quinone oxidoreductase subunit I
VHKEAHARVGDGNEPHHGAEQLAAGDHHGDHVTPPTSRTVVSNDGPVPVTKFLK